ncbi:hypothetical protein L9F63_007658, partial [Diploptera punctata]
YVRTYVRTYAILSVFYSTVRTYVRTVMFSLTDIDRRDVYAFSNIICFLLYSTYVRTQYYLFSTLQYVRTVMFSLTDIDRHIKITYFDLNNNNES